MAQVELREAEDESDRKLISDVQRVGWHVVGIAADADEEVPDYAFSVGLFHSFDHPEIAIYGLSHDTAMQLINIMGEAIANGSRFSHGDTTDDVAEGVTLAFINFDAAHYHSELGYARWFYRGNAFPALQCVWPNKNGQFPWDASRLDSMKAIQPLWGTI